MTPHEALWLIKAQLAKTDQNLDAVKVIEGLVKEYYYETQTLEDLFKDYPEEMQHTLSLDEAIDYIEMGTEAEHIKNHMAKIASQDIHELHQREKYHGEWIIKDGVLVYKEVLDKEDE